MSLPFCNVALPVPLRTTFTYAIPDSLRESVQPGSRVLVPFRNKSLVGVVVECVQHAPPVTKLRTQRQIVLTESGRAANAKESTTPALNPEQHALLSQLREKDGVISL